MENNRLDYTFKLKWVFLTLSIFGIIVYANGLNSSFVSDDLASIANNQNIGELSSVFSNLLGFVRPLIYWFVYQLFGLQPFGFRLINLLFHIGNSFLVYILLRRLTKQDPVSFIAATFFLIHPILTESITWISGGSSPLYSFFLLSGMLLYYLSEAKPKYYYLSLLTFGLSLIASEKAVIFPFLVLLLDLARKPIRINYLKIIPYFLMAFFFGLSLLNIVGSRINTLQTSFYQPDQGKANLLQTIPIAVSSYLELIVWPVNLTLYHSEMTFTGIEFAVRVGIFVLLLAAVGFSFFKNRTVFFGLSFFLISLIPTLTPWGISWIVAERYVYLGTIGMFLIMGIFLNWLIRKNEGLGWMVFILVVLILSVRTIVRNADWKNQDTLWLATARTSPSSPQNHNNLGDYYGRQGNLEKAIEEFKLAIELNPQYGDAYHNLGNTYQQMEQYDLAMFNFQKAISFNPTLWQSYANMGAIYYQQKNYQKAEENLLKAVEIVPGNDSLYAGLGVVYLEQNQKDRARALFKQALEINPNNEIARAGMSKLNSNNKF